MWRLYACRSNTPAPPPDADFRYQGEGTATSVLLPGLINEADATKAPPTINNFPGAAPGALRSRATWADGTPQVDIQGDGYQNLIPAGCMLVWPMTYISSAPPGWEFCQGDSKPQGGVYSRLFARIGTTFGTGSGAGQFSLPNMALRVPIGQDISAYGADVYWATVGANEGSARGTPYTLIEQRDAWEHTHTHSVPAGTTGSSGSGHTHGIPGQANATSSWKVGDTGANNVAALSQFNGHAHGGDTTTTGSGHTHNTVATTAASATALNNLSGVSWHPFLVINWIIKL
jgi:microcystin-dependent protein